MFLATLAARGLSLSDLSDDSVWNSFIPPTLRAGSTATAKTMKPTPPSHCSSERHSNMLGAMLSSPESTVEPVVVTPDMVSNWITAEGAMVLMPDYYSISNMLNEALYRNE